MTCYVPFSNRNLDLSIFVFRPTVVLVDDFVEALKQFSLCTESCLGCVHNSIFKSIHGNMVSMTPSYFTSFQLRITCLPFHFLLLFSICLRFTWIEVPSISSISFPIECIWFLREFFLIYTRYKGQNNRFLYDSLG